MATHLKIVLLPCLLLSVVLMEDVKPVLAKQGEQLKQRTKVLEETVRELKEGMKEQKEKTKLQEEKMKEQEEKIKALEECKACSKIKELNETFNEFQEKNKPKPDIDECSSNSHSCDANAVCSNTLDSYTCTCKAGFSGDGKTCIAACAAVGVEDANQITDAQMTASSIYSDYNPYKGRLNGETGWCQGTSTISNDYIQVDMGEVRTVCAVATQGKKGGSYVTSYKLSLSTDGVSWNTYQEGNTDKVFQANTDLNTVVQHTLQNAAQARYVRFYPVTASNFPCMRVEIFVQ